MKELSLEEWAKRLLEDQIDRLGELRNANPRDPGFKLWRQTTLTVIQRVWPGNLPKSEQFRRIAFTPPSAKPTRAQVREFYERGCGEAVNYLLGLIQEIEDGALRATAAASGEADVAPETESAGPAVLDPEPLDTAKAHLLGEGLIGTGPLSEPSGDPPPIDEPPLRFVSPAFDRDPDFGAPAPGTKSAAEAFNPPAASMPPTASPTSKSATPPATPANAPPAAGHTPRAGRPEDRRALRDMLGFSDDGRVVDPVRELDKSSVEPEAPRATARPGPAFGLPASTASPGQQRPRPPAPSAPPETAPKAKAETEPRAQAEVPVTHEARPDFLRREDDPDPFADDEEEDDTDQVEQGPEKLLQTSPVLTAQARPLKSPRHVPQTPGGQTMVGATLQALAADISRLGVPDGQRAAARAALVGLGRQFDENTVDWPSIRRTIVMALEYPALARLLIPTLVPYLDIE